jgi:hypothetical protein
MHVKWIVVLMVGAFQALGSLVFAAIGAVNESVQLMGIGTILMATGAAVMGLAYKLMLRTSEKSRSKDPRGVSAGQLNLFARRSM